MLQGVHLAERGTNKKELEAIVDKLMIILQKTEAKKPPQSQPLAVLDLSTRQATPTTAKASPPSSPHIHTQHHSVVTQASLVHSFFNVVFVASAAMAIGAAVMWILMRRK